MSSDRLEIDPGQQARHRFTRGQLTTILTHDGTHRLSSITTLKDQIFRVGELGRGHFDLFRAEPLREVIG